jgi:hypothetical protein
MRRSDGQTRMVSDERARLIAWVGIVRVGEVHMPKERSLVSNVPRQAFY